MSSSTLQDGSHVPPQFDMNTVPAPEKSLVPFPGVSDSDKPSPMQSNNLGDLINRFVLVRPVKNPKSYDRRFKWFVTILVAASSAIDPMSSTIFYPALSHLPTDLNTTSTVANLSVALSFIGPAIMPIYWSYIAEQSGRRTVYISSLILYVLFTALAASSSSISMLITMRVLSSTCSGTVAGAAVISDIWEVKEKGYAMSVYYIGPLGGSAIGPVLGGVLTQAWDWRATLWFLTIYSAVVLVLLFICLPETHRRPVRNPRHIAGDAVPLPPENHHVSSRFYRSFTQFWQVFQTLGKWLREPLKILAFTRFPLIDVTIYLSSISYGVLIMIAVSTQQAFSSSPYQFAPLIVGLLYLPRSAGTILGSFICGRWSDRIMDREAKKLDYYDENGVLIHTPEERMKENAWVSIAIVPAALIWFGWTLQHGLTWAVPATSTFFIGVGAGLIFGLVSTMVTEYVPQRSASMVALNSLGRNSFAALGGSITQPLISTLGNGWVYTGVGIIFAANALAIIIIQKNGRKWRENIDREMGLDRVGVSRRAEPRVTEENDKSLRERAALSPA